MPSLEFGELLQASGWLGVWGRCAKGPRVLCEGFEGLCLWAQLIHLASLHRGTLKSQTRGLLDLQATQACMVLFQHQEFFYE